MAKKNKVTNCFPFSKGDENAVNNDSQLRQRIDSALNNFMRNEYGHVMPGSRKKLQEELKAVVARKKNIKDKLKRKTTPAKDRPLLKQQLKKAINLQGNLYQDIKDFNTKKKIADKFIDLVRTDLTKSLQDSYSVLDVEKVGLAMKEAMQFKTNVRFRQITDLNLLDINLLYNTYKSWFDKRNAGLDYKRYKGMGKRDWSMKDSMFVILHNDKSLKGVSLLRDIHDSLNKKSTKKIYFNRKYGENRQKLNDFVYAFNIAYFPNEDVQPVDKNNLTPFEQITSTKNLHELEADLMDGRTKYIVPQPIGDLIKRSKTLKGKDSNALERYNKIVTYAINSGFHISKDIHEHRVGNEVYYYVTMKTTDKNGVEKYEAFLVPHTIDPDTNRTTLIYPKTKGNKLNGKWVAAVKKHQNNKVDLVDTMTEGFRQAQEEKIFNGFNKNNEEIRVKGYSQYTKLDLTLDHPMFKKSRIFPGLKGTSNISMWSNIKEMRELYAEVFDWFQKSNLENHLGLQEGLKQLPNLKKRYMDKYNMTEEAANEAVQNIADALKLEDVLYIDKQDNIKTVLSPHMLNYSTGIKENYYPNMYTFNDNMADLIKSLEGIEDEITRLEEQMGQKQYLYDNADNQKDKRKLGSQLLSLKKRYNIYNGTDDTPGLLEIEIEKIELMLGLKQENEVRKIPTQQMSPYIKHRKLYTNRLKDPDPSVLYGGRRSDPAVFTDYVESMVNTTYNNELNTSSINNLQFTEPFITEYLLEEIKTALGRIDVQAMGPVMALGLAPVPYYVDYSNQRIVNGINNFLGEDSNLTIEQLQKSSSRFNSFMSGNTLGINVSLANNMQGHMGAIIETGMQGEEQVRRILEDEALTNEIVDASGVLDTVTSVADVFLATHTGKLNLADGFVAQKDIALYKLAKTDFMKRAANSSIGRLFTNQLIKDNIGLTKDEVGPILKNLLEGSWEAVNGIAKGTISDKWLDAIREKMGDQGSDTALRIFVTWGMSAYGITDQFTEAKELESYLGMIKGEIRMRRNTLLRGVVMYADYVEPELKGNYTHPRAIAAGRALVTTTMFNFSLQNFPKMFRGAAGQSIWKFKTYPYLQAHAEYQKINNFFKSLKGLPPARRAQEWRKALIPDNNFIGNLLGYDADDVNAFNKALFSKMLNPDVDTSGKRGATAQFSRYIWSRVLVSMFHIAFEQFNIVRKMQQVQRALGMGSPDAMIRGGEGVLSSTVLRTLKLTLATIGLYAIDEDEEDELINQFLRIGTPLLLNVAIETIKTGDPTKGARLVANIYYKVANALGLIPEFD